MNTYTHARIHNTHTHAQRLCVNRPAIKVVDFSLEGYIGEGMFLLISKLITTPELHYTHQKNICVCVCDTTSDYNPYCVAVCCVLSSQLYEYRGVSPNLRCPLLCSEGKWTLWLKSSHAVLEKQASKQKILLSFSRKIWRGMGVDGGWLGQKIACQGKLSNWILSLGY